MGQSLVNDFDAIESYTIAYATFIYDSMQLKGRKNKEVVQKRYKQVRKTQKCKYWLQNYGNGCRKYLYEVTDESLDESCEKT